MLRIDVITLFPEMFDGVLGSSILRRAAERQHGREPVAAYHLHQLRDYTDDVKHRKVDAPPYGGGPGMVIRAQPVWDAVAAVEAQEPHFKPRRVLLTPQGRPLTQRLAEKLAREDRLLLICGHYEGLDQRVIEALRDDGGLDEISIGDYVLTGGELPAMVLIDTVVRLRDGALGDERSAHHDSFSPGADRAFDHPHYTRPEVWRDRAVPGVLLTGHHDRIDQWRRDAARATTAQRRPELLGISPTANAGDAPVPVAVIRPALAGDGDAIATLHRAAFGSDAEAALVDALTGAGDAAASVVAELAGQVVGHALISPLQLAQEPSMIGLFALAPVAVAGPWRRRGIGSKLVRDTLREALELGAAAVIVAGDPAFYGRCGFNPVEPDRFPNRWDFTPPVLQVAVLRPGKYAQLRGPLRYAAAFDAL